MKRKTAGRLKVISNTIDYIFIIVIMAFSTIKPFVRFLHDLSNERNRFTRFFFSPKHQIKIIDEGAVAVTV